jgi:hypothetical protein
MLMPLWMYFGWAVLSHAVRPAKDQEDVKPSQGAALTAGGHLQKQSVNASEKQSDAAKAQGHEAKEDARALLSVRSFLRKLKPEQRQQLNSALSKMKAEDWQQLREGHVSVNNPMSPVLDGTGGWGTLGLLSDQAIGVIDSAKAAARTIEDETGLKLLKESRLDRFLTQEDVDKTNAQWPGKGSYTEGFEHYFDDQLHNLAKPFTAHAEDISIRGRNTWDSMHHANLATDRLHGALGLLREQAIKTDNQVNRETRTVTDLSQNAFQAYNDYLYGDGPSVSDRWKKIGSLTQEQLLAAGKHHIEDGKWDFFENELADDDDLPEPKFKTPDESWIYNSNLHEDDHVDYRGGNKLEDAIEAEEKAYEGNQPHPIHEGSRLLDGTNIDNNTVSNHQEITGVNPQNGVEPEHFTGANSATSRSDAINDDAAFS